MPDGPLPTLYAMVTVHPDGTENLMYTNSGKVYAAIISANPSELERFREEAQAKAMEKGDRVRVVEFVRGRQFDVGGPALPQDLEEQN